LIFIGCGRVGTALRGHIEAYNRRGGPLRFSVAAVVRRDRVEMSDGTSKPRHASDDWQSVLEALYDMRAKDPVVIDVSDARSTTLHLWLIDGGFTVVTANKRPLSHSNETFRRLTEAVDGRSHRSYWFEATVGGGLPVIRAIRELIETGDRIRRVSATLSGTLNFLCDAHARRVPFGKALAQARDLGLTEPDPREDLLCRDVARKTRILASLCNCWWMEDAAIAPIISPDTVRLLGEDLIEKTKDVDLWPEPWPHPGTAVDYVVRIEPTISGSSVVTGGLVERDKAFRPLEGPENRFVIETERNGPVPIIIRGPGAGAAVTATAVFGDLLRSLARI